MSKINPIPSGPSLQSQWQAVQQATAPVLPASWAATVLLSPFGDSISPLMNYSQLLVGNIESSWTKTESWMRTRLYLTQDQTYFDFVFTNRNDGTENPQWYWIDSTPQLSIKGILGPFKTSVRIPSPTFFSDTNAKWGNKYPLMCTDTNSKGINCDHWTDGKSWYAFRSPTGNLFRIMMMDPSNPQRFPILGSYYIAIIPTFSPNTISDSSKELIQKIRRGDARLVTSYWNPMITQEDIHRAIACPLASAPCTPRDIEKVLPGFIAKPEKEALPSWTYGTYIEGWTLTNDVVPYRTRVCYLWTGDSDSKQQSVFIGPGDSGVYLGRTDTCLNTIGTTYANYAWKNDKWELNPNITSDSIPLPRPDWVAHDKGEVMGQIVGNSDFGLASGQVLNLIAADMSTGGGGRSIFWVWFLRNGVGMLFSEGSYLDSFSHLQAIDYTLFQRNAPVEQGDFSFPRPVKGAPAALRADAAHGHPMRLPHRLGVPGVTRH